jgi:hypothetical protein
MMAGPWEKYQLPQQNSGPWSKYQEQEARPPSKPFGQQLNDAIADAPRQLGLTARYALEGLGGTFDALIGNPLRTVAAPVLGNRPTADTGGSLADLVRLPSPRTAGERVVGDAARMVAGGAVPIGAGAQLARAPGIAGAVGARLAANPGAQLASAGAAGAAGGYTRETGGNTGSQLAAALGAGIATPFAVGGAQRVAGAARQALTPRAPVAPQIDITINNAIKDSGLKLADLPVDVARSIRTDVAQALHTGGNLSDDAVRRLADYRLTGLTPTRASLTLNPADVTRQKNLAKLGANSSDPAAQQLAEIQNTNNRALTQGLNDLGAAGAGDPISGAQRIMGALSARNDRAKSIIDTAYASARDTEGRAAMLDPAAFTRQADDLLKKQLLQGKLPPDVRQLLNGTATGEIPFTVDVAEQFKTRLAEAARDAKSAGDGSTAKAVGLVREALENTPLQAGQNIGQVRAAVHCRQRERQQRDGGGAAEKLHQGEHRRHAGSEGTDRRLPEDQGLERRRGRGRQLQPVGLQQGSGRCR